MTLSSRLKRRLDSFAFGPALLDATLQQFPKKMWCYQPSSDRWSIHDIIIHLADSEVSAYIRCRRFIADPQTALLKFNSESWARSLGYFNQSTRDAVQIIAVLRKLTYSLLRGIPDSVWANNLDHPGFGPITLRRWLFIQEQHIPHHIEQMKENYSVWRKDNPPRKPVSRPPPLDGTSGELNT